MSEIQPIVMPKWGLAMKEGMVAAWLVPPGAEIATGQDILEIETSKIANVHESPVAGPLRKIVVQEGETVPVGALLGVVAPPSVGEDAIDAYVSDFLDNFDWDAATTTAGPEPRIVEAGDLRLRYLKLGDAAGLPIIFLHGFGGDLLTWMFNQEVLAENSTTYALDLPGHGGSTKEVGAGNLDSMAAAVIAFMDAIGIATAKMVGHSMGGAIALLLAAEHPDRVASAVLLAPAGLGDDINMDFIDGFIAERRQKKLRPVLEMLVANPTTITTEMIEEVIKYKRLDGVGAALDKLRDGLTINGRQAVVLRDRLDGLAAPVHVIWGEVDQILPVAHADGLPDDVKITRLAGTGHLPHMERASEVNKMIESEVGRSTT